MRVALVTGASRGLGKAIADRLVQKGYFVYYGVREKTNKQDDQNHKEVLLDVENDTSLESAIRQIRNEMGSISLLVNNAGLSRASATNNHPEHVAKLKDLNREELLRMFNVNSIGPVMLAKYALPIMTEPDSFIINVSSIRSIYENSKGGNGSYGYSSTKIALNMMVLMLVNDLPDNISTFAVHPGSVKTDMNPEGSLTAEQSADYILGILESWDQNFNGRLLNYDGLPLGD